MSMQRTQRHVDLSHVIHDGMVTYPGLPSPVVADHLTRSAAEEIYGRGITFQIGLITMCSNTGTYIDVPFHRYPDGHDLTQLDLQRVAAVPAIVIHQAGQRVVTLEDQELVLAGAEGHAVLIRTDHSLHWGDDAYFQDHPALSEAAAERLVAANVACVGIDSLNIDATEGTGERPVHSILLGAGVPIIEHLSNLADLPSSGFRFTAVPPKITGAGTFTVRAYATFDQDD